MRLFQPTKRKVCFKTYFHNRVSSSNQRVYADTTQVNRQSKSYGNIIINSHSVVEQSGPQKAAMR
jgi:ribosomal protein S8